MGFLETILNQNKPFALEEHQLVDLKNDMVALNGTTTHALADLAELLRHSPTYKPEEGRAKPYYDKGATEEQRADFILTLVPLQEALGAVLDFTYRNSTAKTADDLEFRNRVEHAISTFTPENAKTILAEYREALTALDPVKTFVEHGGYIDKFGSAIDDAKTSKEAERMAADHSIDAIAERMEKALNGLAAFNEKHKETLLGIPQLREPTRSV